MGQTGSTRCLTLFLCLALLGAAMLCSGCSKKMTETAEQVKFTLAVVDKDGKKTIQTVTIDKKTVSEALPEQDLIKGEQGEYELYVKTVKDMTLDFATDGKYRSFYVNGEYAMNGVDTTNVKAGATYNFRAD